MFKNNKATKNDYVRENIQKTNLIREGLKKKSRKLGLFAQPKGGRGPEGVLGPNPIKRFSFYCLKLF